MERTYIALGSNLNNPILQIKNAIIELQKLPNTILLNTSSFYVSKPMGPKNQPNYVNVVVELDTILSPFHIITLTKLIELKHGRLRSINKNQWGPRSIDIDIILYGRQIIKTHNLTIPHYGIKDREFVLYPLLEIAPKVCLPNGDLLYKYLKLITHTNLILHKYKKNNFTITKNNEINF